MIPLQETSQDVLEQKYFLKNADGSLLEKSIDDVYERVSTTLANVEHASRRAKWKKVFRETLEYATPAGRILSNAGATLQKNKTSLINCTVSEKIRDSIEGIYGSLAKSAITLKYGCGIGYEFSSLRPKGAFVNGVGAATSGPLSFMGGFNGMCETIESAGGRRGAQMGTFDVSHPDVISFIKAKREDGKFRQFNLSVLITDKFMHAVKTNSIWEFMWDGKVHSTMPAVELWNIIMKSTYDFSEPGFILIDKVNRLNNLWFCEDIRATNPCGEQPLPPNGSCLLGSLALAKFVTNEFTPDAHFDWGQFKVIIRNFARLLDNVVEINGLPLPEQRDEITRKRRHGMGYYGLGSAMTMLGITYGNPESLKFTEEITRTLAIENLRAGIELAKVKGMAPVLLETFSVTEEMLCKNSNAAAKYKVGDVVTGLDLWICSHYFDIFRSDEEGAYLLNEAAKYGCRYTHFGSIAPTGTISLSIGNNQSNGIESSFSHWYKRNRIVPGKSTKVQTSVCSYEYLLWKSKLSPEQQARPDAELVKELPSYFVDTATLSGQAHIDVQAAAQKWIDSSISKTINVAPDYPFDDFKKLYEYAYDKGLKGTSTFRYNPEAFTGVLVRPDDLAGTTYIFKLSNGQEVEVKGDDTVQYRGESHSAANLFDAIKENTFGKY